MTTDPNALLSTVCESLERLFAAGEKYDGLVPSMLDRDTGEMLTDMPSPIEGQRNGDRSFLGTNLMHDESLLLTAYALADACDEPAFAQAAGAYLKRFVTHCADTPSGLFPWGEHSYWHHVEDRVGNSYVDAASGHRATPTHDHLRQAPRWLWDKLHALSPKCVQRFAHGLDNHWSNPERTEYIRHARIMENCFHGMGARSCDFPRHSGFYLFDLAYAYSKSQDDELMQQLHRFGDYWWERKLDNNMGLIESRSPEEDTRFYNVGAPAQTLSLATSLLESAALLDESAPGLASVMRDRAAAYIEGFFAAPHDLEAGVFYILWKDADRNEAMPIWGSKYGLWPASYVALCALCAYRLCSDARLLDWAVAVAQAYDREPFPDSVAVPAMDAGLALGLHADLYDVTRDQAWLDAAMRLAPTLVERYVDKPIPRGAAGIDWYESQMGPGFVLHGIARTGLLARDADGCGLEADYTAR